MMAPSFFEIFFLVVFSGFFSGGASDILSFVDPQVALECLGEKTDEATLLALLEGKPTGGGAEGDYDKKAAETAIQNLASATESIRDNARETLVQLGPAIRARLEDVVSKDARRAEEAKKVLAALDVSRKSSLHRQQVVQILAIRLAADKKLSKLAPAIREAGKSDRLFVRRAAEEALSLLEPGTKVAAAAPASLGKAVEALPAATRFLFAAGGGRGTAKESFRMDKFLKEFLGQMASMSPGGGPSQEELDRTIRQGTEQLVNFVVAFGNFRLERIFVANVGNVGPAGGGIGILLTGDYERDVLEKGLEERKDSGWTLEEVSGQRIFKSREVRIVLLDDVSVLLLPDEASAHFPLEEFLEAFKGGKKALRTEKRWDKFLGTIVEGSILRGLVITDEQLMSEAYKEIENSPVAQNLKDALKGMTEIEVEFSATESMKGMYRLEAAFTEATLAKDMADFVKGQIQEGIRSMEQMVADMGGNKAFTDTFQKTIDLLKGIRVAAEGKKGILRGEADLSTLLSPRFFMGATMVR